MRRSFVLTALLSLLGCVVVPTPSANAQTVPIAWSVNAGALLVSVVPPIVGDFQLGTTTFRGSGTVTPASGAATGRIVDSDTPLPSLARSKGYRPSSLTLRVLSGVLVSSPEGRQLRLRVRITASNARNQCVVGSTATVTLIDSDQVLDNGESADFAGIGDFSRVCGHVHGWSNEDKEGTDPPFGGPGGGSRADVRIAVPAASQGATTRATAVRATAPVTTVGSTATVQSTAPVTTPAGGRSLALVGPRLLGRNRSEECCGEVDTYDYTPTSASKRITSATSTREVSYTWSGMPSQLAPGAEFTITIQGKNQTNGDPSNLAFGCASGDVVATGLTLVKSVDSSWCQGRTNPTGSYTFRVPSDATKVELVLHADNNIGNVAAYCYGACG